MKLKNYFLTLLVLLFVHTIHAQQVTGQQNSQRQSRYPQYGPSVNNQIWETPLSSCFLTMPTWYFDGKAYFGRYTVTKGCDIVPNSENMEELLRSDAITEITCMDVQSGEILWTTNFQKNLFIIGIQNEYIFVMNFTGGAGLNYMSALSVETGELEWEFPYTCENGSSQTVAFAPNGDLILPGPNSNNGVQRVSPIDGSIVWATPMQYAITGNGHISLNKAKTTGYTFTGWFLYPQEIVAFDVETGEEKYRRMLPNDQTQQTQIVTAPDNRFFVQPRDYPGLTCYQDTGFGIDSLWCAEGVEINFSFKTIFNKDNSIIAQKNNKLVKLDFETGEVLAETAEAYADAQYAGVDLNGYIYFVHGYPAYLDCFSPDLVSQYQIYLGDGCAYTNGIPGPDGIMVVTTRTKAFALQMDQSAILFPPNDFVANVDISDNEATFDWTLPNSSSFNIEGYNIYKNGTKINNSPITDMNYSYVESSVGNYHYYATTVYSSGESDASFYDFLAIRDVVSHVEGSVVELSTGDPIANAEVTIGPQTVVTAADGSFEIGAVAPDTYDLITEAYSYNIYNEELVVNPGEQIVLTIELTQPDLSYNIDEIVSELYSGEQEEVTLTISNNGNGPANWNARLFYDGVYKKGEFAFSNGVGEISDLSPKYQTSNSNSKQVQSELQFSYDMEDIIGHTGIVGAETDGLFFYIVEFNSSNISKLSLDGVLLESFSIEGVDKLSDLAWDGQYFYGCYATSGIFIMDFENKELIGEFTVDVIGRSIAYDVEADGFWIGDWNTPIKLFDRQGTLLNTISGVPTVYGTAYDNVSEGGPYLWLSVTPESGVTVIEKWDIESGTSTGEMISISDILGSCSHGGLFLSANLIPNTVTVGGIVQGNPDILYGINIGEMNNWIIPEEFSGTIEAGETQDIGVTIDATNIQAGESLSGRLLIDPNPEIGNHTIDISLDVLTSLDELSLDKGMVFPNPVNSSLNIELEETSEITIYSTAGVLMWQKSEVKNSLQLDVNHFAPGIYFVNIKTPTEKNTYKVIVL